MSHIIGILLIVTAANISYWQLQEKRAELKGCEKALKIDNQLSDEQFKNLKPYADHWCGNIINNEVPTLVDK
jgi:hypothetical protein